MKTFFTLLKKELRELITWQIVVPLLFTALLFFVLGNVLHKEQQKAAASQPIILVDQDHSPISATVRSTLVTAHFSITPSTETNPAKLITLANEKNAQVIVIVPAGFGAGINNSQQQQLIAYSVLRNFSLVANKGGLVLDSVVSALNSYFGNQIISLNTTINPAVIRTPIITKQYVVIGNNIAQGNAEDVIAFVTTQTTYIPIILFFVIIFAAQMIATAVASEKENKTLETLLTMPISRRQVVTTKMLAAGIVALLASGIYLLGFRSYMNGLSSGLTSSGALSSLTISQLGLHLGLLDYALLGIALFMGILVALALAMILGTFAEDVKSVQGLITPLIVLVMVPYVVSLLLSVNDLSKPLQYIFYAIPFSNAFLAAPNLFLQQPLTVLAGIAYSLIWFIVLVAIAAKIFTTDRIVTLKINFSKKKHPTA